MPHEIVDPDEKVILIRPKHWIHILPVLAGCALLFVLLLIGSFLAGRFAGDIAPVVPLTMVNLGLLSGITIVVMIAALAYWIYRQNQLILTDKHLIQVEQLGLFNRRISRLSLSNTQDVSSTKSGLLATILNVGSINVESAVEQDNFIFTNLADPDEVAHQVLEACKTARENSPQSASP